MLLSRSYTWKQRILWQEKSHYRYCTYDSHCNLPAALVDKQKAKAIKQAKKLLQQEGILPLDEPIAS